MIPVLGKLNIKSPVLAPAPSPDAQHPLAPRNPSGTFSADCQRAFLELWRAVYSLLGVQQDPAASVAGVAYRWRSANRVSMPQAALASLLALAPRPFTASDIGLLIHVSDYNHLLEWDGTKFNWGPGDAGSGWTASALVAPTSAGWHVCDGTAGVKYLKSDGSLGAMDLPTTPDLWFRQ